MRREVRRGTATAPRRHEWRRGGAHAHTPTMQAHRTHPPPLPALPVHLVAVEWPAHTHTHTPTARVLESLVTVSPRRRPRRAARGVRASAGQRGGRPRVKQRARPGPPLRAHTPPRRWCCRRARLLFMPAATLVDSCRVGGGGDGGVRSGRGAVALMTQSDLAPAATRSTHTGGRWRVRRLAARVRPSYSGTLGARTLGVRPPSKRSTIGIRWDGMTGYAGQTTADSRTWAWPRDGLPRRPRRVHSAMGNDGDGGAATGVMAAELWAGTVAGGEDGGPALDDGRGAADGTCGRVRASLVLT